MDFLLEYRSIFSGFTFFALAIYPFFEARWIKNVKISLVNKKVPESFDGMKIVFLADIHYGLFFNSSRLKKLVEKVNLCKPDLIIMGGDFISGKRYAKDEPFRILSKLKAKHGVLSVLGNHEHYAGAENIKKLYKKYNLNLIDNAHTWIKNGKDKILVAGVGDLWRDKQYINPKLKEESKENLSILISHNPDYFTKIEKGFHFNLALSGHSHGGQFSFFGIFAPIIVVKNRKYLYGLHKKGGMNIYTTSGIGTTTPPYRFFANQK